MEFFRGVASVVYFALIFVAISWASYRVGFIKGVEDERHLRLLTSNRLNDCLAVIRE